MVRTTRFAFDDEDRPDESPTGGRDMDALDELPNGDDAKPVRKRRRRRSTGRDLAGADWMQDEDDRRAA